MKIEITGRNIEITEEIRAHIEKRFQKIAKQVSDLAQLEVVLREERNPAIPDSQVVEARLFLKGNTLRVHDSAPDVISAINHSAEQLARQVKRYQEKRRRREVSPLMSQRQVANAQTRLY